MNDVAELKEYVRVHARGQRIGGYQALLDQISSDDADADGSWVGEWCRSAEALTGRDSDLDAARRYAMAAFPFVDGPARQQAHQRCLQAFGRWRQGRDIEPVELKLDAGLVQCWAGGLSPGGRKPLLIVMGGIVTLKEQWAPLLTNTARLGMAGVVTEMPGVGENELRYEPDSWRMLSALLDTLADRADVTQTYAIALSFSGHMALRCALEDSRIRGVITVGAPIGTFFTDRGWQRQLPQITVDTLAGMTGIAPVDLAGRLDQWALTPEQLSALRIPVAYTASRRDEIIPASDVRLLREHVRRLELVEHDDVHGSPEHVRQTQLWTIAALMRARGIRSPQSAAIGLLLRAERARRVLSRG